MSIILVLFILQSIVLLTCLISIKTFKPKHEQLEENTLHLNPVFPIKKLFILIINFLF